ncbi:MAG: EcoRII N-terminal effector-binding domain-containing protein [Planctomycetaceae bacterium]|nr:hypothetical protein [Planctomycetaceae bacterium]
MKNERPSAITKILSRNDTGETGGHQAGILVPRNLQVLSFFPSLDRATKNPRHLLLFTDTLGESWSFAFIYYNNTFFGGTRNEYRLTRMTPYLRSRNLKAGDRITLRRDTNGQYTIECTQQHQSRRGSDGVLHLGTGWKVIRI